MQNLGITIKIGSTLEGDGFNAAQKALSKIKNLNQSALKTTLSPKVNLSPLNKLKTALGGIKAQLESLRNKELELKVQSKIDSFKSSFIEKAAIGASIAMPVKAAIDFESSMADVKKVVDFDSKEELNAFGAEIRKLSQTIPLLPTELAKITASGGQLGIAKKDLMGFTTLVAKIGTAFDMSAQQAGDTMAKIMNVYGLGLKEMEGLGDTINHISDNSAAKASEITEVLQRIGGTAKVMGLSAENAAALGSAFIAMGKAPEVAGTAINSLFTKLLAPEKQTAGFRKALEEIGLSAEELKDSIQNNPQKGLEDFLQTLTEVEKSEQMGILSSLFGAEFGDDMALLVSGIDNYKKAVSLANDKNKVGSLQREFETRAATTENALTLLKSSVLNLGITIGSILLPPLNMVISAINPIVNGFAALCERFPKISGAVVGAVATFGSFIVASAGLGFVFNLMHLNLLKALPYFSLFNRAVMGSVAWLKAKNLGLLLVKAQLGATMVATKLYGIATLGVSKAIALSSVALKTFGAVLSFVGKSILLNPIFLIGALIAGSVFLIYKYWTPLKEFFSNLWSGIKEKFISTWEFYKKIFKWSPLGLIISAFSPISEYLSKLLGGWIQNFQGTISKIGETLSSIKSFFGFGETSIKAEQSQIEAIQVTPLQPQKQNNIQVAFTGGIHIESKDGKIPQNSELQRDIQREVEMALKKAKESERNRTLSDIEI
ncbi:phage tail tape measure protein [Helicobacter sp. UBA3407]|uniref:phage tail tape measure protein n=1 Tax=Helicobacter TaxID=209 RepID=UPI00262E9FF1|nr:phage tail tape measure protein [Helicobacter sp. UBA3407]